MFIVFTVSTVYEWKYCGFFLYTVANIGTEIKWEQETLLVEVLKYQILADMIVRGKDPFMHKILHQQLL